MLSRLVITFLPRSKRLLVSWLQLPSAVILEPQKIKSDTVSTVSPSISHEVLIIREMQIKSTTEASSYTGQNGHHQKYLQAINAREDVEKREPSCTVDGNVN